MNQHFRLGPIILAAGAVMLGACGGASGATDEGAAPSQPITAAAREATAINIPSSTPTSRQTAVSSPGASSAPESSATPLPAGPTGTTSVPSTVQPTVQPTPPPPPPAPRLASAAITVHANNGAFDTARIRLPAGANVSSTLINDEAGVVHNLTFGLPGVPHGDDCIGPCTRSQTFRAPTAPGSFFFLCTIHDMFGELIIE